MLTGAMHGRAAVPSAAASRQDGGSPCGSGRACRDYYGEPPSRRLSVEAARVPLPQYAIARGLAHNGGGGAG